MLFSTHYKPCIKLSNLSPHRLITKVSIILGMAFLTSTTMVHAAEDKTVLRELLAKITTLQASFTQVVNDKAGQALQNSAGKLILQQPDRLYWQVLVPDETLLVANGERVFYVDEFVEQVSIFSQNDMVANNPLMLLTSNDEQVWSQFSVSYQQDKYVVVPNDGEGQITQLTLAFVQDVLSQFTLLDNQGQVSQFTLNDTVINMLLPVNQFSYTIPEGFSIDDQTQ